MNAFAVFSIGFFCFALGMVFQHKLCMKRFKKSDQS